MIRFVRSLVWLRRRIFINTLRSGAVRGRGERWSRLLQVAVPIVVLLLMVPASLLVGGLALWAGVRFAGGTGLSAPTVVALRIVIGLVSGVVVILPVARSLGARREEITRLRLLPIPRRTLHAGEVLAGLADPWLIPLASAALFLGAGFVAGGAILPGMVMLAAGCLLVIALLLLASCASYLVQIVFRNRRRADLVILVGTILLSSTGLLVALFVEDEPSGGPVPAGKTNPSLFFLPSELYVEAGRHAAAGRAPSAVLPLAGLAALTALAFGLSSWLHRRLLDQPAVGSRSRRRRRRAQAIWHLPGVSPAMLAVAKAQLRTFPRTVKGKMAVYVMPILVILTGAVLFRTKLPDLPVPAAPLLTFAGAVFCLLGNQPLLANLFATDGAGLTLEFVAPISDRELVQGKVLAGAALAGLPALACGALTWVVVGGRSPLLWLAALLAGLAGYLVLAPIGAILSAILPRKANLASPGKDGNPHAFAGLLCTLLTSACVGPPALLAAFGRIRLESDLAALLLVTGWTVLAAGIGHLLAGIAADQIRLRRENLLLVAQGR